MNQPAPSLPLRKLAAVDRILSEPTLQTLLERTGRATCKRALQALQHGWRQQGHAPLWAEHPASYRLPLEQVLRHDGYQRVFNLTGTLVHTNLGRSPLAAQAVAATIPALTGAMNLEFDLETGRRGQRDTPPAQRLCELTGAEAATFVNNCAAALVLTLNTFALGREVPVSRGELIEIGGSFRLPDIMRQAGARLVEVGTTNRTRQEDFAAAITDQTGLLLKVHPSNFEIRGFSRSVTLPELSALGTEHQLPVCEDLGSGALIDLTAFGLPAEPTPQQSLARGADLVLFSGDKLLGGPQAGIILGRKRLVDALNRNPLKRALRLDKVALTLLDETLKLYENPETLPDALPILRTFKVSDAELESRGRRLLDALAPLAAELTAEVLPAECQIGSGAQPETRLPSQALRLTATTGLGCEALQETLRSLSTPIIGRVAQDAVWLDLRCAEDLDAIAAVLTELPDRLRP